MKGEIVGAGYLVVFPQIPGLPRFFPTEEEAREYYDEYEEEREDK